MTKTKIIPHPGFLLRAIINAAGYRRYLTPMGLVKNLDDLANEAPGRKSTVFAGLQEIEKACVEELKKDCGHDWATFFRAVWSDVRHHLQTLAQTLDMNAIAPDRGRELMIYHYIAPVLSNFLKLSLREHPGPDMTLWRTSPFKAWAHYAASRLNRNPAEILDNLANAVEADPRTIERWLAGSPVGKISWPYAPKVAAACGTPISDAERDRLSGWLMLACAFQTLPEEITRGDFTLQHSQPLRVEEAIAAIQQEYGNISELSSMVSETNEPGLLLALIDTMPSCFHERYPYIYDWLCAKHSALISKKKSARQRYAKAVSGSWWSAGNVQCSILEEALLFSVGIGDKNGANDYWDKTFMLGLNEGPKRPLDEQELRRLSMAFEYRFSPLKAHEHISSGIEFRTQDDAFHLSQKHLKAPNAKNKYMDGGLKRTPLMMAILEGSLEDVKKLITAGGNPDSYISESGEGPLMYAMRRACDRKDTAIMDYLLEFDLQPSTVNRAASTARETPLKIAIEMANAAAISRLIALGADVEAPCDTHISALNYALALLHERLNMTLDDCLEAWAAGQIRPDAHDARRGGVLDAGLAAHRQSFVERVNSSAQNRKMAEEHFSNSRRSPEEYRASILALLEGRADANRRYRLASDPFSEWTPTLFAAEIGDLTVFRMLIEHKGDPDLTLEPVKNLARLDALWIAIMQRRHQIVSYLQQRD